MKIFYDKKIKLIIPLVFVFFLLSGRLVFAVWNGDFYDPGQTFDPECAPSPLQPKCDVLVPFSTYKGVNSDGFNIFIGGGGRNSIGDPDKVDFYTMFDGGYNVSLGAQSFMADTTGWADAAVGAYSLTDNTTGWGNSAFGDASLRSNTTGFHNTAVGQANLHDNTTGNENTSVGDTAMDKNTTGADNVALGHYALWSNTTGSYNTAIGSAALHDLDITVNDLSGYNTALGANTGQGIITGVNNTIIGANVTGLPADFSNNIIIADGLGNRRINVNGSGDVGIGTTTPTQALDVAGNININTNGQSDLISTYMPTYSVGRNLFMGGGGLNSLGDINDILQYTGGLNAAFGFESLLMNTTGWGNSAFGEHTLVENTTGIHNTAVGQAALYYNVTGGANTAVGDLALSYNTTGVDNVALGHYTLTNNTTGSNNTAIGRDTLHDFNITTNDNLDADTAPGWNTAIGAHTGEGIVTGVNNTIVGANVTGLPADFSNNIIIADGLGNRRINVNGSGDVGIGTTTPGAKLEVNGNIKITAGSGGSLIFSDGTGMTTAAATSTGMTSITDLSFAADSDANGSGIMSFATGGNERVRITNAGNVGIGTTTPAGTLEIGSGYLVLPNGDYGTPSGLRFENAIGNSLDAGLYEANNDNLYLQFGGGDNFILKNHTGGSVAQFANDGGLLLQSSGYLRPIDSDSINALQIKDYSGSPYVNFDSTDQRVGIGTAAPTARLQVNISDSATGFAANQTQVGLQLQNTDATTNNWTLIQSTSASNGTEAAIGFQHVSPGSSYADIAFGTMGSGGWGERMRITSSGNVGIGTTSPGTMLTVGTAVTNTGNITVYGTGTTCTIGDGTGGTNCTSDAKLKTNVNDLGDELTNVMALRPVTFNWIDSTKDQTTNTGLIAQEVQTIFPSMVHTVYGDYLGIDYAALVVPTIKAVQELNLNLDGIAGTVVPVPGSATNTFVSAFFNNIETKIGAWLADAGNGIGDVFAGTFHAKDKLCINNTCVTESQLQALLVNSGMSSPTPVIPTCTPTQTLVNNVCTDPTPTIPTCTPTQTLVNNVCIDPLVSSSTGDAATTNPTCTPPQTLVNNVCTDPTPTPDTTNTTTTTDTIGTSDSTPPATQ